MALCTSKAFSTLTKEQLENFDVSLYSQWSKACTGVYETFQKEMEAGRLIVNDLKLMSTRNNQVKREAKTPDHTPHAVQTVLRGRFMVDKVNGHLKLALITADELFNLTKSKSMDTWLFCSRVCE